MVRLSPYIVARKTGQRIAAYPQYFYATKTAMRGGRRTGRVYRDVLVRLEKPQLLMTQSSSGMPKNIIGKGEA